MAENTPRTAPTRPPHWVSIALIASLCLNFLFIGLFSAALWQRHDAFRGAPPFAHMRGGEAGHGGQAWNQHRLPGHGTLSPRIMMDMVPEKADAFREILQSRRDGLRPLRQQTMAARNAVYTLLQGKDYSDAKLKAALDKVKAADTALEEYALETLRLCYARLSPAERQKLASVPLQQIQDFQQRRMGGAMQGRMNGHGGPRWQHRHGEMPEQGALPEQGARPE